MIEWQIEQGSNEWFAARRGRLTASNFNRAMSLKGRETLLREMNAEIEDLSKPPKIETYDMRRGKEHEDRAVAVLEMTRGVEARRVGYIEHNHYPLVLASADRILFSPEGQVLGPLEVKCPRIENMGPWMYGDIPFPHLDQLYCQIWCLQSVIPSVEKGCLLAYNEQLPPAAQIVEKWLSLPARWVERAELTVEWFTARVGRFELPTEEGEL